MSGLFEVAPTTLPIMVRCDCKTRMKDKVKVKRDKEDQPLVTLYPGIDPRYFAGQCKHCKKQHIERIK